jgi:hypothetical protein
MATTGLTKNIKPLTLIFALIFIHVKPMGEGITEIRLVLSSCLVHPYFGNAHDGLYEKHKAPHSDFGIDFYSA